MDEVNKLLLELATTLNPLEFVMPLNEVEERDAFFNGKENPEFTYKKPSYDTAAIAQQINSITSFSVIPELQPLLAQFQEEFTLKHHLIQHIGDPETMRTTSEKLYGRPDETLLDEANELLQLPVEEVERQTPGSKVKEALEEALAFYKLDDWKVEYSPKRITTVNPPKKLITLNKERLFKAIDPLRLATHEIGVHVLRGANGYLQPISFFAFGFPGYYATEEGLAVYCEDLLLEKDAHAVRRRAAHVLAANSLHTGQSFRSTFTMFLDRGFTPEIAWRITLRTYRGGGFAKDHLYLQGLRNVRQYAEQGGDVTLLFVGKVGLEHLDLVKELLEKKIILPPKYLPKVLTA